MKWECDSDGLMKWSGMYGHWDGKWSKKGARVAEATTQNKIEVDRIT